MRLHTTPIVVGVLMLASALSAAAADDPIAALNAVIQSRFSDIDTTFGLRRIVVIGDTPHRFRPETVRESEVVQSLDAERLRVALYVAGRRVLEREPDLTTKVPFALNRRVIFGPVAVTDPAALSGLPDAVDLIDDSRLAFRTLERRGRYDFTRGAWSFSARPIRAASAECLTCHQGRQVGDALGVVLYASQGYD